MLVILAVLQYSAAVVSIQAMECFEADEAMKTFELVVNYVPITIFNFLLLAPSIEYVAFCYLPLFLSTVIYSVLKHSLNLKIIIQACEFSLVLAAFWFILQKRELKKFFEQQETKQKEKNDVKKQVELTKILN